MQCGLESMQFMQFAVFTYAVFFVVLWFSFSSKPHKTDMQFYVIRAHTYCVQMRSNIPCTLHKESVDAGALSRRRLHLLLVFLRHLTGKTHLVQGQLVLASRALETDLKQKEFYKT